MMILEGKFPLAGFSCDHSTKAVMSYSVRWTARLGLAVVVMFFPALCGSDGTVYRGDGFTVTEPGGGLWRLVQDVGAELVFERTTAQRNHTALAFASSVPADSLSSSSYEAIRNMIHDEILADLENSRFQDVESSVMRYDIGQAVCAGLDFSAIDRGVPYERRGRNYVLEGSELVCLHPDPDVSLLIRLGYSQRYRLNRRPLDLGSEIEVYFGSLKFVAPNDSE
jgi:hypothetical protein